MLTFWPHIISELDGVYKYKYGKSQKVFHLCVFLKIVPNPYPPFFHLRRLSWAWNSEINSTIFVFRTALYIIEQDMKKRIQPNFLGFRKSESIRLFSWGGSVLEKQAQ